MSKHQLFVQYPSLISVLTVLKSNLNLPEVQELLKIYTNIKESNTKTIKDKKYPLIVLEGLDGCGKSHTSKELSKKLNALLKSTPPPSISMLREKFDNHNALLRRAFYSLGNYIAEIDLLNDLTKQPVVMDRFWHSTAAYAMANELIQNSNLKLPEPNDELYNWPNDLIKPDVVIFLTTSEETRLKRLSKRKNFTLEEDELKRNEKFRQLLNQIYKNMKNPELIISDNSNVTVYESAAQLANMVQNLSYNKPPV